MSEPQKRAANPQVTDLEDPAASPDRENPEPLVSEAMGLKSIERTLAELELRTKGGHGFKLKPNQVADLWTFIVTGEYVRATLATQVESLRGLLAEQEKKYSIPILRRK